MTSKCGLELRLPLQLTSLWDMKFVGVKKVVFGCGAGVEREGNGKQVRFGAAFVTANYFCSEIENLLVCISI